MKLKYLYLSFCITILFSCNNAPEEYLNDFIDTLEQHSINKDSINWVDFRRKVLKKGSNAKNIEETYPTIRYALKQLGDNHSFLMTVRSKEKVYDKNNPLPDIKSELINDSIAYLMVPAFMGNEKRAEKYANRLQGIIKEFDKNNIAGWIIDLRENGGGNMWPMLLGIGPILEKDTVGYFLDTERKYSEWIYSNGSVFFKETKIMALNDDYTLLNKNKKKAVLISSKTGSSGEAIAVSFKGSNKTMFFGQKTKGLSTANQGFKLSDGAIIFLTSAIFADRNKKVYGIPIEPEYYGLNAKEIAINWIMNE